MSALLKHKLGILLACCATLSYMCITPVLANMTDAFPAIDPTLVQMVVTLPSLLLMPFSLIAGQLARRVSKKMLALLGISLELLSGLIPLFFHAHIFPILLGSAINGCGLGLMMSATNGLICECFEEDVRSRMLGLNAAFVNIGALFFGFVGGQLSRFGWHCVYFAYLVLIPVLLLAWRWMPEGQLDHPAPRQRHTSRFSPWVAGCFVIGFLYFASQNAFNTNAALYISELQLGNAMTASYCTMGNSLGGIFGGIFFGTLERRCRNQIETAALLLSAVGFLAAFFAPSLPVLLLSSILIGCAFAFFNASGTLLITRFCRPGQQSLVISAYLAVINLGAALSPVLVSSAARLLGDTVAQRILLVGSMILTLAVCSFGMLQSEKKQKKSKIRA